jgi:serpin B
MAGRLFMSGETDSITDLSIAWPRTWSPRQRRESMRTELLAVVSLLLFSSAVSGSEAIQSIAASNNAFAIDLYGKLAGEKGNIFFSPYSIETALAMACAGAKGPTAGQMARTLRWNMPAEQAHAAFADLIRELNASGSTGQQRLFQLVVANALWGQKGYPFHKSFQEMVKASYEGQLAEVDFAGAAEQARQTINRWVEKQTNDKIKDLIGPRVLTPLTRLVLTNAIYFKSNWASQFSKVLTKDAPFHLSAGQTADVPLMHREGHYSYAETEQAQVLELPYVGYRLSMVVILPRQVDGLPALEKELTQEKLDGWFKSSASRKVQVTLPRFKFASQFSLADVLKSLGMTDAFSPQAANFSGMASAERLFISAVLHKAYVDVNEEGTEAAAATAIAVAGMAMPQPEEPVVFKADHPFLFVIRHRGSGAILFMGRVEQPQ